jgi:nucleoside transporter
MPATPLHVKIHLGIMMFLQFAINGIWTIPLVTYLKEVHYSDPQVALAYTTLPWAAIVAPLFVGMIADRFFAAEKVLAVLNLLGGVLLYLATLAVTAADGSPRPVAFFWVLLGHCVCYMPTWSLTSSVALAHVRDASREFPLIRVMGTIGWIVVSAISLVASCYEWNIEKTVWPLSIGAGLAIVTGIYDFFLPHTPPQAAGKKVTVSEVLGLDAVGLLRNRNLAALMACSFLIMIPASFYWTFCDDFLNEIKMTAVQFKMSIGQMSEMIFMFFLPFFLARLSLKLVLSIGLLAWVGRYLLFAFGNMEGSAWMLYLGLIVHGACFAFVFVTGPIYTDRRAPKQLQASAQGLLTLITFGLGSLLGTYLAGQFLDHYHYLDPGGKILHDWRPFWLWPAAMAAVTAIVFFMLFSDKDDTLPDAVAGEADETPVTRS